MYSPPNELYTAFSFIGFVLCAIPLYWHLETWNTGTCLYMIWVGLGCLLQCINSIVWNKNMINRAPVYCDISTRFQVALNVAIPASSLCINRRLYKAATAKTAMSTDADKRRAVTLDLLIGVGIPILQIVAEYVTSPNRYNIFEDFGPVYTLEPSPLLFILFSSWPVVIGTVSFYYCVRTIYAFYKRQRQFRQIMMSSQGLSRGRYLRLMALSSIEILGTIPFGTYLIVSVAKTADAVHWKSWAFTHYHYSDVIQVPGYIWKNERQIAEGLEMFRWLLVACAFLFFAFFGFADDARQHYRRVYMSLASRIGYPTPTPRGSPHVIRPMNTRNKGGVIQFPAVTRGGESRSSISLSDDLSTQSAFVISEPKPDLELGLEQDSLSNTVASSSVDSFETFYSFDDSESKDEPGMQGRSTPPAVVMPAVPPASVPPHLPDKTQSTVRASSGIDAV